MNQQEYRELRTRREVIGWRAAKIEAHLTTVSGLLTASGVPGTSMQSAAPTLMRMHVELQELLEEEAFIERRLSTERIEATPPAPGLVEGVETSWVQIDDPDPLPGASRQARPSAAASAPAAPAPRRGFLAWLRTVLLGPGA